jgi:peptidoglycan/LPS O-acetylase OafA/YrhL
MEAMGQPSKGSAKLTYRSDVDGLRAVAVLLVIADHLRTHFGGGYIGVDVFFVISGYLISAAILKEMAAGTFSIVNFYERRVRRIFPALIVMLLGASALAYHYLFPTELADFARSLLAAMFSVSNIWFWHQAGYFDAPSAFKPLLHTWSLGVEEQFYIFFPILLVLIRRFLPRHLRAAIFAFASITFALAIFYVRRDATAAFFFSPLRAWELLIGTIVSQRYLPAIRGALARNIATLAGILLILVPSLLYTAETPFPGIAAVPPCIGAALIIAGGEYGSSVVGRILSLRPVVFVGLISYSLYLWHWPVLAFQNIGSLVAPLASYSRTLKLEEFAISLALGYLSWKFVETPFRKGRLRPNPNRLFLVNGIGVAVITAIGLGVLVLNGLPRRFPPDALQAASYLDYTMKEPFREGLCFIGSDNTFRDFNPAACLPQTPGKPTVLLLGDSQAAQLWPGMHQVLPRVETQQATAAFCTLVLDEPDNMRPACRDLSRFAFADYLPRHHVDAVFYGGRWTEPDLPAISRTVAWMQQHGIKVYLFGPMLEYDEMFPRVLAAALRDHKPEEIAAHMSEGPRALDAKMARLARDQWHVPYISYFDDLCAPRCPAYGAPGVPLLFDEHHFTAAGSELFVELMRKNAQLPLDPAIN